MLTLAALLVFGQIVFDEQSLPEVRIGPVTPFTGHPATNYLQADMNGDGALDLLLPGYLALQAKGLFPESRRAPLPPCNGPVEADVFGGSLYYREAANLSIYTWTDGAWRLELQQPLEWPGEDISFSPMGGVNPSPVFRRFTYDVDGDSVPELVGLDAAGIHFFRRTGDRYEKAGELSIFPTTVINRSGHRAIWPPEQRQVVLPEQSMSCRLLVLGNALSVITDLDGVEGRVRYRRDDIALASEPGKGFTIATTHTSTSEELPDHVRPCRLNDDGDLDYAGAHWILSDSAPVPMPVHETWASLDGGKSFQIERAATFHNFRPLTSFVDFDSDGDLDMVVESTSFFESGLRESINQYLSRKTIPHAIRIHAQAKGQFSQEPLVCAFDITLDAPPVSPGPMLARYQAGELVNVTGDFNGDGFEDLALRRSASQLEIRLTEGWTAFAATPAALLNLPAQAQAQVADINGDGRADVLVRWEEGDTPRNIVYVTRKVAP